MHVGTLQDPVAPHVSTPAALVLATLLLYPTAHFTAIVVPEIAGNKDVSGVTTYSMWPLFSGPDGSAQITEPINVP